MAQAIIGGGGAHIHKFVFTDHKNSQFQKKLMAMHHCLDHYPNTKIFHRIRAKGIECKTVGVGATPTCSQPPDKNFIEGITEFHPGNYVFYGRLYPMQGHTLASVLFLIMHLQGNMFNNNG